MEREHGRIVSVSTRTLGSPLDADTAAGATSLVVFDAGDFDESGGTLNINGAQLAYSTYDDDTATITLTDPLPAAASDGDFVACWDTLYDAAGTEKTAMVQLDGDDDNPDPIEATVPHFLADKLDDGDRGGPGESVVVEYDEDEDEWLVADVRGLAGASGAGEKHCNTDTFTVQAVGDQTIALSHTPDPDSMEVVWHPDGLGGITLTRSEWSLDRSTLIVPDPNGLFAVNDLIDPLYAYRDAPITPSAAVVATPSLSGWRSWNSNTTYSSVPLPAGTQVGDIIIFSGSNYPTVNDSRLTYVSNPYSIGFYIGTADTLDDLQISGGGSGGGNTACYGIATYHNAQIISTQVVTGSSPVAVPSVSPAHAVALMGHSSSGGGVIGSVSFGSEFSQAGQSAPDYVNDCGAYWIDMAAGASPATTCSSSMGTPQTTVLIVRIA